MRVECGDWRDSKYREVLESTLRGLERRRSIDPSFGLEDAEGILRHLYIQDGNDQGGRGELQDIVIAATIAAHEQFIAELSASPARARPLFDGSDEPLKE